MEESWRVGTEHVPVENRRRARARARTRSLSRSRYSIVVRFDIFSGHVDPPRGQTSFRADVLMTSISPFFHSFSASWPNRWSIANVSRSNDSGVGETRRRLATAENNTVGDRDRFDDRITRHERVFAAERFRCSASRNDVARS